MGLISNNRRYGIVVLTESNASATDYILDLQNSDHVRQYVYIFIPLWSDSTFTLPGRQLLKELWCSTNQSCDTLVPEERRHSLLNRTERNKIFRMLNANVARSKMISF